MSIISTMQSMHCEISGTGAIALICIHGWGCEGGQFAGLARALDPDFRVYRPDLPGHGATPLGSFTPSFDTYAGWIADFIESRGLENPILFGHSMGGMLSLLTAARLGVRAVINLDGPLPATDDALAAHAVIRRWLDEPDFRVRLAGALRVGFTGGVGEFLEVEKTPETRFPKKERARSALTVFSSLFRKQLRLFNETSGVNLAYI
jgi:pimeloyl-ACP methyl ester carboxylesterase